jgi:hypothetical protein
MGSAYSQKYLSASFELDQVLLYQLTGNRYYWCSGQGVPPVGSFLSGEDVEQALNKLMIIKHIEIFIFILYYYYYNY